MHKRQQRRLPVARSADGSRHPGGFVEQLEARRMLAHSLPPLDVRNLPTLPALNSNLADLKNGPMATAGPQLLDLYGDFRRFTKRGGVATQFKDATSPLYLKQGQVLVTLRTRGSVSDLATSVRLMGGRVVATNGQYSFVDAFVPIGRLRGLSSSATVVSVSAVARGASAQEGSANNQADQVMLADQLRSSFNLDGRGIKIGVLSDSVSLASNRDIFGNVHGTGLAASIASGDLPANGVEIIEDGNVLLQQGFVPTDEGRAMLEEIHDIAPGASLAFATAEGGQQHYADNIRALAAAGCKVIVDDFEYFVEPYFQPGVIDQAIADFVNRGGIYVAAVGNADDNGYDAPAQFTAAGNNGQRFIDFDPGTDVDTRMTIQLSGTLNLAVLQWDNPYNGVVGAATSDLDIYFYALDGSRQVYSGTSNNLRTGLPMEQVLLGAGTYEVEIRITTSIVGAQVPTRFKISGPFSGSAEFSLLTTEYSAGLRAATYGHSAGANTISVGAVDYLDAPPFGTGVNLQNETFSSEGPVTHIFDINGNRLASPLTLSKPDISAVDDVNTSFFVGGGQFIPGAFTDPESDSLPNFRGTSAAAPNVAAVVALMLQANPRATQAQVVNALKATATPLNGAAAGEYDIKGGFGLVNAYDAIQQFLPSPNAHMINPNPDPSYGPISRIKVYFDQQISGFDISDLTLSTEGGTNLLTGENAPVTIDGGRTWWVRSLQAITGTPGIYTLTLPDGPDTGITNLIGEPLNLGATISFTVFEVPAIPATPTNFRADALASNLIRLRWDDNAVSESNYILERATNQGFSINLKTITIGANKTSFDDTTAPPGTVLYYRLKAVNGVGQNSSLASPGFLKVVSLAVGETVLDNSNTSRVTLTGTWDRLTNGSGFIGDDYFSDANTGKGSKSVRFTPSLAAGTYRVYLRVPNAGARDNNVPVDIVFGDGARTTVFADETKASGSWIQLGDFHFVKGSSGYVEIRTLGTTQPVLVDAVRWQLIAAG